MAIRYINNFDNGLYTFPTTKQGQIQPQLAELFPAYDLPTAFNLPGFNMAELSWGPMQVGSSTIAPTFESSVQPSGYVVINQHVVFSNGALITVNDGIALARAGGPIQSKTFSLIPSFGPTFVGPLMAQANSFSATLDFDMPFATGENVPANPIWAVGLRFKTGTTEDAAGDQSLQITCQFSSGGSVRFHGTDFDKTHLDPGTYQGYNNYPATQFSLRIEVDFSGGKVISGTGTLEFGAIAHSGSLLHPNLAVLSAANTFDASQIKVVGAAIVTTSNGFNTFGARLRSFSLDLS